MTTGDNWADIARGLFPEGSDLDSAVRNLPPSHPLLSLLSVPSASFPTPLPRPAFSPLSLPHME